MTDPDPCRWSAVDLVEPRRDHGLIALVRSRTVPGRRYAVRIEDDGTVTCACPARHGCWHAEAALDAVW